VSLNSESKYPSRRAYVVKVRSDAPVGALAGRLENLVTGTSREFGSGRELLECIASDLAASGASVPRDLPKDPVYRVLWTEGLEEVDREIARLAVLCQVKLLEPGVIARVLNKDASVCGKENAAGFRKLRELIMLHLAIREKSLGSFGPAQTAAIEDYVIERLRNSFPDLPGGWPPT
jgi:hypothetical protein